MARRRVQVDVEEGTVKSALVAAVRRCSRTTSPSSWKTIGRDSRTRGHPTKQQLSSQIATFEAAVLPRGLSMKRQGETGV